METLACLVIFLFGVLVAVVGRILRQQFKEEKQRSDAYWQQMDQRIIEEHKAKTGETITLSKVR